LFSAVSPPVLCVHARLGETMKSLQLQHIFTQIPDEHSLRGLLMSFSLK
jgi:hypothetical protein